MDTIEEKWQAVQDIPGLAQMSPAEAAKAGFAIGLFHASEAPLELPRTENLMSFLSSQRSQAWQFFAGTFGIA